MGRPFDVSGPRRPDRERRKIGVREIVLRDKALIEAVV